VNHTMFWNIMKPHGGGDPTDHRRGIKKTFGDFKTFQEKFNTRRRRSVRQRMGLLAAMVKAK